MKDMKTFALLYERAFAVSKEKILSKCATCGGVGSALLTKKGNTYVGSCVDCSCGIGFCAEHTAIATMLTNGESEIQEIIAVGSDHKILPPCGRCREFIMQVNPRNKNTLVHLSETKVEKLTKLLPKHWAF